MLRSVNELKGFEIVATDGEIGDVEEFYFDDERWALRYIVVNTGNWLSGRQVLISPFSVGFGDHVIHQLHGGFKENPRCAARAITLNRAVFRVGCVVGDVCQIQSGCIRPRGM